MLSAKQLHCRQTITFIGYFIGICLKKYILHPYLKVENLVQFMMRSDSAQVTARKFCHLHPTCSNTCFLVSLEFLRKLPDFLTLCTGKNYLI